MCSAEAIFTSVFGRRLGTATAIATVILYTVLVGADAAVVRAAVMGVMAITLRQANQYDQYSPDLHKVRWMQN